MDQKRVLVCGGAGFLGSHLCKRLVKEGHEVVCVDNLCTGRLETIQELLDSRNFRFIDQDINEPVQDYRVDEIYNLACPGSPEYFQNNSLSTFMACTQGSFNLLDMAARRGSRILLASACSVYGDSGTCPQDELDHGNVDPVSPRACYNEGKRCAETMFMIFNKLYKLPVKIARIFNTYGPGASVKDGRVVSNFIVQALQNEPLIVNGDGSQTRSFCYVDDMIDGLMSMMSCPDKLTGPFNFGNPEEITIKDLAAIIIQLTDSKSCIVCRPSQEYDPERRKPNIDRAIEEVQWWPRMSLKDGIVKTIDYFDEKLRIHGAKACLRESMGPTRAYAGVV